jgi:hypothetical protein
MCMHGICMRVGLELAGEEWARATERLASWSCQASSVGVKDEPVLEAWLVDLAHIVPTCITARVSYYPQV